METYILGGARTSIGSFMGELSQIPAPELAKACIRNNIENVKVDKVDEVILGQVLSAGSGQAPARQAALLADLPHNTPSTTVNKVCGSGMKAFILGSQSLDVNDCVIVGGMENMSMAPHLLNLRKGQKFGEGKLIDHIQFDGLCDAYSRDAMGVCAEECAEKYGFSREEQDLYAKESYTRSQMAIDNGYFGNEICEVEVKTRKGTIKIDTDEEVGRANFEKMGQLRPAFRPAGTITAANASSINDGACTLILGNEKYADQGKFRLVAHAQHATDPVWFTTAPIEAMKKCLTKANLGFNDIDYFEINEAFSVVPMAAIKECGLSSEKVNPFGGAVSLGHPIGCSGARIILTLMNVLTTKNAKRGMASICIGGGEALAVIIEKIN